MTGGAGARRAVRTLQRALPRARSGLVILAYHLVGAGTRSPVDLPAARFRRQMEELVRTAEPISLPAALGRLAAGLPAAAPPAVAVTFDDAHENFVRVAWPVLRDLRIPVALYVPTGFVDRRSASPIRGAEDLPPASWDELGALAADELVTIGSHGVTHANLALAGEELARRELAESRRRLEERLGIVVEDFCYPEGGRTRAVERLAAQRYRSAVAAGGRRVGRRSRPMALPRVPVRCDMPEALAPVLGAPVWLEEWLASRARALRWRRRRPSGPMLGGL
jgi:peptidoglycan/xylan/chitin deacetylase (PgdA/CDA1 family)